MIFESKKDHEKGIPLVVRMPVIDLRREPIAAQQARKDLLQESQLLYNEPLYGFERSGYWIRVAAPLQQKQRPDGSWQGYPGWVQVDQVAVTESFVANDIVVAVLWAAIHRYPDGNSPLVDVCLGTHLRSLGPSTNGWQPLSLPDGTTGYIVEAQVMKAMPTEKQREKILGYGRQLVGAPYLWGGKSVHNWQWNAIQTSVDCSGLVHLLYSICGFHLPRDAHDQYQKSYRCEMADLQPADLLFTKSHHSTKIDHVMLYLGEGQLLEATARSWTVRMISFEERCGKPLRACHNGEELKDFQIFAGSFL